MYPFFTKYENNNWKNSSTDYTIFNTINLPSIECCVDSSYTKAHAVLLNVTYNWEKFQISRNLCEKNSITRWKLIEITKVKRKKLQKQESDCSGNLWKILRTKYEYKIGLNPGLRLVFGGVQNGKPIKLKNLTYHSISGFYSRSLKLKKYTKHFREEVYSCHLILKT